MRKITISFWALGVLAAAAGCSSTAVDVGAKHADLTAHQTELGGLNTPNFALGDVVELDPTTHTAWRLMSAQVTGQDLSVSAPMLHTSEPFAAAFDLSFSQSVPKSIQSDVAENVNGGTLIHVENYFSRRIKAPLAFAVANDRVSKVLKEARDKNPEARFFLVSDSTAAEKVYLTYSSATLKDGQYQFSIEYPQNKKLEQMAKETACFFKTTPLTLSTDEEGHVSVTRDAEFSENLSGYNYTQEVAAGW